MHFNVFSFEFHVPPLSIKSNDGLMTDLVCSFSGNGRRVAPLSSLNQPTFPLE